MRKIHDFIVTYCFHSLNGTFSSFECFDWQFPLRMILVSFQKGKRSPWRIECIDLEFESWLCVVHANDEQYYTWKSHWLISVINKTC